MGKPSLVLLPGLDGTGELFAPLQAELGEANETIVVRYPLDPSLGYQELEAFVRERLPACPFVLLAESFSGPLGIRIAARPPPGFKALILVASFARSPARFVPSAVAPLVRSFAFRALSPRAFIRRYLLDPKGAEGFFLDAHRVIGKIPPAVLAARVRDVLRVDACSALAECSLPILYLRARRDRIVSSAVSAELATLQPALQIVDIDAPHLVLQCNPRESARAIREFLEARGND